jgi:hypothetical protein
VDIAFIVDGTLRSMTPGGEWKPDIDAAKKFVVNILEEFERDTAVDALCALCLYGDWKYSGAADYALRKFGPMKPDRLRGTIENEPDVSATEDRDYEALLESALHWTTKLPWRPHANKLVVVIGYAPPHPPRGQLHPDSFGFQHEPFTSPFNWESELSQLRDRHHVQVLGIWVPYPDLDRKHRCMRYSHHVWVKLGDREPYAGLAPEVCEQFQRETFAGLKTLHIASEPIAWPLIERVHTLRCR